MIPKFDEIEKQLKKLAPVINSFESEAVQLRIIELVFHGGAPGVAKIADPTHKSTSTKAKKRKSISKPPSDSTTASSKEAPAKRRRVGATPVLDELLDEGYFNSPRTIADIRAYTGAKKARNFKTNELSTPLARFVRAEKLSRSENADGQYQYTVP